MTRSQINRRYTWLGAAVLCVLLAIAIGVGVAQASRQDAGGVVRANTAGQGAHPHPFNVAAAPAANGVSETLHSVLADAGVTKVMTVAQVGAGDHVAQLVAATRPGGDVCFTVAHAAGRIVEPLNCDSGAYLRIWTGASGSGDPAVENSSSARLIALVSAEVSTVRVTFADGSSRLLTPDSLGVVSIESAGGAELPLRVDALATDGTPLVTLGG